MRARLAFGPFLVFLLAACERPAPPPAQPGPPPPKAAARPEAPPEPADAEPVYAGPDVVVDEPLPPFDEIGAVPDVVASGEFVGGAAERAASGRYRIYQIPDSRLLRIEELRVADAEDLELALLPAADSLDGAVVVAALKGISGNQNYIIDVGLALRRYRALAVISRKQNLVFARAPLGGG